MVPSIHRESSLPEEGIHRLLFREKGQAAPHLSHNLILRELIGNQPTKLDFLIESECHRDRIINLVLSPL